MSETMETETKSENSDFDDNDEFDENDDDNNEEEMESDDDEDEEDENGEMDEKNEKEFEEKLNSLKNAINENKYVYQNYVDIIELTRQYGDLNSLRTYRESMSEIFPLTENLWLEWIQDEQKFIESSTDRQRVYDLFKKAVQDYLSIDIWVEYIQFSIGGLNEPNGMANIREICERAVLNGGHHLKKGFILWEAYREFECAILAGLKQSLCGTSDARKIEGEIRNQNEKILNLYKRQLGVCLDDMENTFEEFKQFISENEFEISADFIKSYENTFKKYKELSETYETNLINAVTPEAKLEVYKKYIESEITKNESESRIKCLYERAIADGSNCLDAELWLLYSSHMLEKCENSNAMIQLCKRGIRNCPWLVQLWIYLALKMEQNREPKENIKKIYNEAMNAGLQKSEDYLQLWHCYIDFLRRQITDLNDSESIDNWRITMQIAINQLFEYFKHEGDPKFTLEKYWARIEAKYFKNIEQSRKIWNEMIMQKNGMNMLTNEWVDFYNFECQYGDEKHQRKVLQRALNEPILDDKYTICELFNNFEKVNGSIDSYLVAKVKIENVLLKLKKQEQEQVVVNEHQFKPKQQKKEMKSNDKKVPQQKQKNKKNDVQNLKRKKSEDEFPSTKMEVTKESKKDKDGFTIPSLPMMNEMPPPSAKKAKSENEQAVATNQSSETKKGQVSNKSVFLSNLSFDAIEADVEQVLKNCPGFQTIRLIKNWSGKSKGFGYADFDTQEHATDVLKLDRTQVKGRPMFISACEDKSLNSGLNTFKYENRLEKNKLFVSNLPFETTKEQLEEIFKAFGKLKEVRIVTYKSGKSKGLAYVDFEDEASATKAILQTDNMLIGKDHQIAVALSNPPKRPQQVKQQDDTSHLTSSLGSGTTKQSTGTRTKGPMFAMTPRSVTTKTKDQEASVASTKLESIQLNEQEDKKPMSNADFRSLLLKK